MPLPPLPANNTDRYWLKYTYTGVEHELCFRLGEDGSPADAIVFATNLANALDTFIGSNDSFSGLRYALAGGNISIPLPWTPVPGLGPNDGTDVQKTQFVALSGRTAGGRRCRITFFCNTAVSNQDFRAGTGGTGPQGTLYAGVTSAEPPLVGVDGLEVVWNAYVNQGFNAYWQRQMR